MSRPYGQGQRPPAFPRAAAYAALQAGTPRTVCEPRPGHSTGPPSERHLQCVWLDPRLRPPRLHTDSREQVRVLDPGIWNLEAGPDFIGATVEVGPDLRRLHGDVELHIRPSGWYRHRHHEDPLYRHVRIHVTYFPGNVEPGLLPPGTVEVSLQAPLAENPQFSFDAIDVTAYPFSERAACPPCQQALLAWSPEAKMELLDAAGEERLRRKSERIGARIETCGAEQAVYEEVFTALGYKHNRAPFRQLAGLVPHADLRREARGDPLTAYALLVGVAGLMPTDKLPGWDEPTRRFVRSVWDRWWKVRERWERRSMPREAWRMSAQRPANHPLRRLMAAAHLFTTRSTLADHWRAAASAGRSLAFDKVRERLMAPSCPYWNYRLAIGGRRQDRPVALLGEARAQAMVVNVVTPWLAAVGVQRPGVGSLPGKPSADAENHLVRQAAHFLFGPDHPPRWHNTGLRRQGLLQIFHDFCLNDRSRCAACILPSLLRAHRRTVE